MRASETTLGRTPPEGTKLEQAALRPVSSGPPNAGRPPLADLRHDESRGRGFRAVELPKLPGAMIDVSTGRVLCA